MIKQFSLLLFSLLVVLNSNAIAASCCGGGFASPSVITGDEKAQLTGSVSNGTVDIDVYSSGIWKKRLLKENVRTLRIEGAHIFSDRWQLGGSVPVLQRSLSSKTSAGLGDSAVSVGFETIPNWSYNVWKPKAISFLSLTIPTGKSLLEADEQFALDARGRGFWALGIGSIFLKDIGDWDVLTSFEVHRSFSKSVSTNQFNGELKPGFGGTAVLGAGHNIKALRLGAALAWNFEEGIDTTGSISSEGSLQRFVTGSLQASYVWNKDWASTLSYSNQTLFGSPLNSSLAQIVKLSIQKRWAR